MQYLQGFTNWLWGSSKPAESLVLPPAAEKAVTLCMPDLSYDASTRPSEGELQRELESQGFFSDGVSAYSHESSYSLATFQADGHTGRINMDRGGFVQHADGSYSAALGDGLGGLGGFSAYAAAMATAFVLKELEKHPLSLGGNAQETASELFRRVAADVKAITPALFQKPETLGATTLSVVSCVPLGKNTYKASVATLGDGAVFYLSRENKTACQVNEIHRARASDGRPQVRDTGGCLTSSGDIDQLQNISTNVITVAKEDFLVLVTDGLLDNIQDDICDDVVQLVAFSPLFDKDELIDYPRFWEPSGRPRLPTLDELTRFVNKHPVAEEKTSQLTAAKITKRLANYVKLVTHSATIQEEALITGKPLPYKIMPPAENKRSDEPKTDDCMIITIAPST